MPPPLHPTIDDAARFEALYAEYGEAVLRYALRRTTRASADDVVAETFLVAWRRLDRLPAEPRGWLLAVARRALANQRRGERRRDALAARLAVEASTAQITHDHDHELAVALASLRERDREALLLVHWDGLAPSEAAKVLGLSGLAFRSRLHRARRRLGARLAPGTDDATSAASAAPGPDISYDPQLTGADR